VLLNRETLDRIVQGDVTLAFRRWKRPTVRAGGTLRTCVGVLAMHRVDKIELSSISRSDARKAGFSSLPELVSFLKSGRQGAIYRIQLSLAGPDPRIALRKKGRLSRTELEDANRRLDQLDARSRRGAWTHAILKAIAERPNTRAAELAEGINWEPAAFKTHVRKLKELGLTESLEPGYRLSPRGRTLLAARPAD
jgi:hypothetical protein